MIAAIIIFISGGMIGFLIASILNVVDDCDKNNNKEDIDDIKDNHDNDF